MHAIKENHCERCVQLPTIKLPRRQIFFKQFSITTTNSHVNQTYWQKEATRKATMLE